MKAYCKFSDQELIKLLSQSDQSAFNEIYRRYFHLIYVHAYKKLGDEEQAKDIVQDLFTTLWFNRGIDFPHSNLPGYLFIGARNRIFDLFARNQVKAKYLESINDFMTTHLCESSDHLVRSRQLKEYIDKQIEALPPKMQRIFIMSRTENLSHKEIALKLNTSENNVSKQIRNALRALKLKLNTTTMLFFAMLFI